MEIVQLSWDENGQPLAAITRGHVPLKEFLQKANEGWSDPVFEQNNSRYEYGKQEQDSWKLNVRPDEEGSEPITAAYFEEGNKELIKQFAE